VLGNNPQNTSFLQHQRFIRVVRAYGKAGKPPVPSFKGQNADKVPSTHSDRWFGVARFILVESGRIFLQI
jgi:cation diffusion facilitator CzcD-associated flavoprotein CzcO